MHNRNFSLLSSVTIPSSHLLDSSSSFTPDNYPHSPCFLPNKNSLFVINLRHSDVIDKSKWRKMARINSLYIILFSMLVAASYSGCSLFDNDAPEAMFIDIPSVSVSTTTSQGEPTHNITDVWVNVNGILVGAYPLPAKVPVIINDLTDTITIFPGIRNNGSTSSPFQYRLMAAEQYVVDAEAGKTIVIEPVFKYSENAIFDFVESFEGSNIFTYAGFNNSPNGAMVPTSETAASGLRSGKISLDLSTPLVEVGTTLTFDGDQNGGSDSYLEIDYKNDIPFFVGIYKTEGSSIIPVYDVVVAEKEDWNKIYIDFTLELSNPNISEYRVVFLSSIEQLDETEGNIFIDNVKFVHF